MNTAYNAYLNSPDWLARRTIAIRNADGRCQICNHDNDLHVHHRTYERFGHEDQGDLTVLCRRCHDLFHTARQAPLAVAKPLGDAELVRSTLSELPGGRYSTKQIAVKAGMPTNRAGAALNVLAADPDVAVFSAGKARWRTDA